jgi:hypothetical protein
MVILRFKGLLKISSTRRIGIAGKLQGQKSISISNSNSSDKRTRTNG